MKTKKANAKKPRLPLSKHGLLVICGISVVILLGAAQFAYNKIVWSQLQHVETTSLKEMLIDAIYNVRSDLPVDAKTGQHYLATVKLKFPEYPAGMSTVRYSINDNGNPSETEIQIAHRNTLNLSTFSIRSAQTIEDTFESLPKAQACSRQVLLSFKPLDYDSYDKFFEKQLSDGRMIYMYLDEKCPDNSDELIEYLKQIDSY